MLQNWLNGNIFKTKRVGTLIFCSTTPFSDQLSSFKLFPDTSNNWLTKIFGPRGAKRAPKRVQNGYYSHIFEAICSRMLIFGPTTPFSYQLSSFKLFPEPPITGYQHFWASGCQKGSKKGPKWVLQPYFRN